MKPVFVEVFICKPLDSPASNGGRGLKHAKSYNKHPGFTDSPASNGGRGLKLDAKQAELEATWIRPPAMAGVD